MLEPAVRPVAVPGAVKPPGNPPFEQRPFEDLLAEANLTEAMEAEGAPLAASHMGADPASPDVLPEPRDVGTPVAGVERPPDPLAPLADLGRIENVTLRNLIAQRSTDRATDAPLKDQPEAA